jgi:anti-sigma-K factor RskA
LPEAARAEPQIAVAAAAEAVPAGAGALEDAAASLPQDPSAVGPAAEAPAAALQDEAEPARRPTPDAAIWRAVAAFLAIIAVGLGGLTAYRQWVWPRVGDYVAVLQAQAAPAVTVRVDPESGVVFVRAFAPPPPEGMAYHLWLRPKDEQAVRLGSFSAGLAVRTPALGAVDRGALGRATLAVTLGPAQGTAAGDAPGPVLFEGRLAPE